jgi:aspartate-semialdehyde dehydrogenase
MSRFSTEPSGPARVAVVGASSVDGSHLRDALAERGLPGGLVDLYGTTAGEVVLSEYAGEARMIQEIDLAEVARHDLIFICEPGEAAARLAEAAGSSVIIDLQGALPAEARPAHVPLEIDPESDRGEGRFTVPHPLALVLAEVLLPLERRFGLSEAMAVVLRPAADFGHEGLEELREQTVRLLNFSQVPIETFGCQLAFNLVPDVRLATGEGDRAARIAGEVTHLLGWDACKLTIKLLAAPVFHGHGIQLRFRLADGGTIEGVREVLEASGLMATAAEGMATTPLEVTGEVRTGLSDLSEDGIGGYWVWGVAGETGSRAARQAVQFAAALFGF